MPINYGLVDPTEGMNRGLGTLAQALQYRQQMERQAQQDAMTAKSHGLQDTLSQMKIDTSTAEQNALMGATGQPDLQSALGTQLKAKMEAEAQKLQAEKLTRYSTVLEHLSKAPFDDATKTEYLKAAIGKDPDFAEFLKSATIQTPLNPGDFELKTLYGPGGATKSVPVSKTGGYTSESGWSLTPPLKPDTLSPEAEAQKKRIQAAGKDRTAEHSRTEGRIKNEAYKLAAAKVRLKYGNNSGLNITTNSNGQISISQSGSGNSDALGYFETERDKLVRQGLNKAIQRGSLPKDYAPEKLFSAPTTMQALWSEAQTVGSSSKAKALLMDKYNYNEQQAIDIIKQGLSAGALK